MLAFDELWERLNSGDESVAIEAKRGSRIDRSVMESVSAFANEPDRGGGYLLLGVAEAQDGLFKDLYEAVGVADPDKIQADLASQCRDVLQPPVRPVIVVERFEGKNVVVAFIPESTASDKPVYIKSEGLPRGAFRRIGPTDQHCTEDDLALLFQNRKSTTFDQTPVDGTTVAEIDPAALAEYRRARAQVNPTASELALSDEELLHALYATDGVPGSQRLTVAGLMLFGTERALRRQFSMIRVDYIRVEGREWVPDPEKRYAAVEMRGPLLTLIPRVVQQVIADIPMTFSLGTGGLHRRDVPVVPRTVIREAIVNALMHRSYRTRAPLQVIRYANRIEIRNPGHSLKPDDRLGDPGSIARNEKIAAALHEAGLAETKGTGIRAMREAMSKANLTLPIFESDHAKDEFTVRLLVHHLLGPEDLAWLAHFKECQLSPDEAKSLLVVREMGAIDNSVYRDINRVDTLTASTALRRLRDLDLLQKQGKGSATYYVPTTKLLGPVSGADPSLSPGLNPGDKGQYPGFAGLSPGSGAAPGAAPPPEVPESLAIELRKVGERTSPPELRELIRRLCEWKPLRTTELAEMLGRDREYIQKQYLRPMLRDGDLEFTKADPADPQQAYRAVRREGKAT